MDVHEAIRTKRATRRFTAQPISDEGVWSILNAGRRAQSSKNSQPWQFIAIQDRETLRRLSECGTYAGHLAGAALGVAIVTSGADEFDAGQAAAYMQLEAWGRGIGSCIASMWEPERAKEILGIPPDQRFDVAISFGYPAGEQPARPVKGGRRPLKDIVRWERW
jgi:nitroreductase